MPPADDVDPSLLESLEDSTSSSDIPKSKMDKVRDAYFGLSDKIAKNQYHVIIVHGTIILLYYTRRGFCALDLYVMLLDTSRVMYVYVYRYMYRYVYMHCYCNNNIIVHETM